MAEMKICNNGHTQIVYSTIYSCPLCQLTKHDNTVHDFIESKGQGLIDELVKYQKDVQEKTK